MTLAYDGATGDLSGTYVAKGVRASRETGKYLQTVTATVPIRLSRVAPQRGSFFGAKSRTGF